MRLLIVFFIALTHLFGSHAEELNWEKGTTLLTFLNKHKIPQDIYFNQSKTDQELCSEIVAGVKYHILFDDEKKLRQALIPISEEMQLHITRDEGKFALDIIPIEFEETTQTITIPTNVSPYIDILEHTANKPLANELLRTFKKSVNFKRMRKGDLVSIKYTQRIRMGQYFGMPKVHGAMVEVRKKKHFIFENINDGQYYDDKGRSLTNYFFKIPVRNARVSSGFTYKRFHPILKRYRAHLGVDYAAPVGRPIYATSDGKIIHRGRKGGYGKTIIIRHSGGYKSLYAHMHKYKGGLRVGSRVKQGQLIGYVGSTGRSTGPHLHFGIYKNGRAVNPAKLVKLRKEKLFGKSKKTYLANIKPLKEELKNSKVSEKHLKLNHIAKKTTFNNTES